MVVAGSWSHMNDYPRLVVIAIPAETHWFKVLESGEAVKLVAKFVVRHHRVGPGRIRTVSRDAHRNPLDATRAYSHIFSGIAMTVIRIEINVEIATIGVVSDILNIIVDGDRIGVIGQHGL